MTQAAYEAIMSVIDSLIEEDYQIIISKSKARWDHYDGVIYLVKVMDGEVVVTQAESGILSEAMGEVYQDTPER